MPVVSTQPSSQHGKKDARRHREKQKEAIRDSLPDIIADESIITRQRGKTVKIPIKILDIPHFRPKKSGGSGVGVGQGPGRPGDVIGQRPGQGPGKGPKAGQEPGVDYIETEVELDELIEMALEDIGLPNLKEKNVAELEVILGFKIRGIARSGPWALLNTRATAKEGMKRYHSFISYLKQETKKDELACFDALKRSEGNLNDALAMLADPAFTVEAVQVEPFPIITNDELRFRKIRRDIRRQSRAVIIAMMDVSGSMTTEKKYLARIILFWLVQCLRKMYDHVEIRFVIHHTQAKIVPEEDFFHTGESGGTYCYTAYELANSLIDEEYPTASWNVYPFHFSDGEDFDTERSVQEMRKLFEKKVNMLGYGELHVDHASGAHQLLDAAKKSFPITAHKSGELEVFVGDGELPFLGVIITKKEQVWPALREFLKKDRWAEVSS